MDETTADFLINGPKTDTAGNVTMYDLYLQSKLLINMSSFFCELIIFIVIFMNKRMHTRTNKVIMCLITANASCFFYDLGKTYVFTLSSFPSQILCLFDVYEVISETACFLCIFFLLYDDLITTKKITDRSLLIAFYLGLNTLFVVQCLLWPLKYLYSPLFYMIPIAIVDITIFCMLVKDMKIMWKYVRGIQLDASTLSRMNIARIYLCCWLLIIISNYFCSGFGMFLTCIGGMSGIFTLIFLINCDDKFNLYGDSAVPNYCSDLSENKAALIAKHSGVDKSQHKLEDTLKTIVLKK